MPWQSCRTTMLLQLISYQSTLRLKSCDGSQTKPRSCCCDFSGSRSLLPAKAPETRERLAAEVRVVDLREEGRDGRGDLGQGRRAETAPQLARNSNSFVGRNFRPTFGVTALPKSL